MTARTKLHAPVPGPLLFVSASVPTATAAPPDHWVGTWAAAPVSANNSAAKFGAADTTYREIVHVSLGGSKVRIVFTNEFGTDTLTIGAAQAALSAGKDAITPSATVALAFGGKPSIVIPAGALAVSDPVNLALPPFSDLAVSFFVPAQPMQRVSIHNFADQTSYTVVGNAVTAAKLDGPEEIYSWPFLEEESIFSPKPNLPPSLHLAIASPTALTARAIQMRAGPTFLPTAFRPTRRPRNSAS